MDYKVGTPVTYSNAGKRTKKMSPGYPETLYNAVVIKENPVTIEFTGAMPQGSKTMTFQRIFDADDALYVRRVGGKRKSRKASRKSRKATRKSRKGTYRRRR